MIDILGIVAQAHHTVRWTPEPGVAPDGITGLLAANFEGCHVSDERSGGTLGRTRQTTFTAPVASGLTAERLAAELAADHRVATAEAVSDETLSVDDTMVAIERERQASVAGLTLQERIAKVSPETLRAIESIVVHDERLRTLTAVEGRS